MAGHHAAVGILQIFALFPLLPVMTPQRSEKAVYPLLFSPHTHTMALWLPVISLSLLKYRVSDIRERHAGKDPQSKLLIPRKAEPWILPHFNQVMSQVPRVSCGPWEDNSHLSWNVYYVPNIEHNII